MVNNLLACKPRLNLFGHKYLHRDQWFDIA